MSVWVTGSWLACAGPAGLSVYVLKEGREASEMWAAAGVATLLAGNVGGDDA